MSMAQFEVELRRLAKYHVAKPIADPLTAAVNLIGDNPMFAQSRLMARVLNGLTQQPVEFRRAEASAFDSAGLMLVVALIDASRGGTAGQDWSNAVGAANAAIAS